MLAVSKISTMAIAIILAGFSLHPAMATESGEMAPEFILPGQSGQEVRLSDFKNKVIYLDFWASWCGPCKQSFTWMNSMQTKYGAQGLQIIAVNLDAKAEDARQFILENSSNFMIAMGTKTSIPATYKIKVMPTSLLIGQGGKVIERHAGFRDDDKSALESSIKQALMHR